MDTTWHCANCRELVIKDAEELFCADCAPPCPICTIIRAKLDREKLAKRFHYFYETLAPSCGYETRKESRVEWDELPESNRELMLKTCDAIIAYLKEE